MRLNRKTISALTLFILAPFVLVGCDAIAKSNFKAAKGIALYNNGRYNEAVVPLKEAIQARAEHGKAHYYLALTYMKLGEKEKAISFLKSYLGQAAQTKTWLGSIDREYIAKCKELVFRQGGE